MTQLSDKDRELIILALDLLATTLTSIRGITPDTHKSVAALSETLDKPSVSVLIAEHVTLESGASIPHPYPLNIEHQKEVD